MAERHITVNREIEKTLFLAENAEFAEGGYKEEIFFPVDSREGLDQPGSPA